MRNDEKYNNAPLCLTSTEQHGLSVLVSVSCSNSPPPHNFTFKSLSMGANSRRISRFLHITDSQKDVVLSLCSMFNAGKYLGYNVKKLHCLIERLWIKALGNQQPIFRERNSLSII